MHTVIQLEIILIHMIIKHYTQMVSLDLNAFNTDLERNLTLLRNALGENFNTNIIRCPGGFNHGIIWIS